MTEKDYFDAVEDRVLSRAYASYPCDCTINLSADLADILFCGNYFSVRKRVEIVDDALNKFCGNGYIKLKYKDRLKSTIIVSLQEKGLLKAYEICTPLLNKIVKYMINIINEAIRQIIIYTVKILMLAPVAFFYLYCCNLY